MSLTAVSVLIALTGFFAALAVQLRSFTDDQVAFARRRKRAALSFGALLFILGFIHAYAIGLVRIGFGPEEDGSWGAISIDGRPVSSRDYTVFIRDGRVEAGRDGCNSWGYTDDPPGPNGERMILSTLVACYDDDPARKGYYAVARSKAVTELRGDLLRLSARGHEAIFRRCTWVEEPLPTGTSGSGSEICVAK